MKGTEEGGREAGVCDAIIQLQGDRRGIKNQNHRHEEPLPNQSAIEQPRLWISLLS